MRGSAVIVLFLLSLSGCSSGGPPADASELPCNSVLIPPPALGAYTYNATGFLWAPELEGATIDWSLGEGGQSRQGALLLPPGGKLRIAIEPARLVLNAQGGFESAFHVGLSANRGVGDYSLFADEWVAERDGALIAKTFRNLFLEEGQAFNSMRLTQTGFPPILGLAAFWNQTITPTWSRDLDIPPERLMVGPTPSGFNHLALSPEGFRLDAHGRCVATVQGTYTPVAPPGAQPRSYSYTFLNDSAWPLDMEIRVAGSPSTTPMLRLENFTARPSGAQQLPPFTPGPRTFDAPMGRDSRGFLPVSDRVFPTTWPEAMQALGNDIMASAWLGQHPDATVLQAVHLIGAPGSTFVDFWYIAMSTDGDGAVFQVEQRTGLPLVSPFNVRTTTNPDNRLAPAQDQVSLQWLAGLWEQRGEPVEVLQCDFLAAYCSLGSHTSTKWPYYNGSFPGSATFGALSFRLDSREVRVIEGLCTMCIEFE